MCKIFNRIVYTISILILFCSFSTYAGVISPDLQSFMLANKRTAKIDVIIEFKEKADISNTATELRRDVLKRLRNKNKLPLKRIRKYLKRLGKSKIKNLWINNSVVVTLPSRLIPLIASLDDVLVIKRDRRILLETAGSGVPPTQLNWNISTIGADKAWNQGITGQGIVVGTMDTGVDINHPDLSSSWRGGSNSWFDPYGEYPTPHDTNGHGTQTTSLIIGGNSSGQAIGVAPGAKWIAAKIFDNSNVASISAIHLAFQWMLDPDDDPNTDDGVDILNNSWNFGSASGQCDTEFQNDINILRATKVAVVFAAGNTGPNPDTSRSPANNNSTIPVGGVDESLNVAFSSSRGPNTCVSSNIYPKLAAPGINVYTADLTFGGVIPNSYTFSSGTSFAAPHVSGAFALLQSKYPFSSLNLREEALNNTAIVTTGNTNDLGHGIIDIDAALQYIANVLPSTSLLAPIGQIPSHMPTYTWDYSPNATHYGVWVKDPAGIINKVWYTPSEVNCDNGEATCYMNTTSVLADGSYLWKVRVKNNYGLGSWSPYSRFTIGVKPDAPVLNTPSGIIGSNHLPDYIWNAITGVTEYKLWVRSSSGEVSQQWYSALESGCANNEQTCSIAATTPLLDGVHRWKVRGVNTIGVGPWSTIKYFTIGSLPNAPILISPIGNIGTNNTPVYRWNAEASATNYKVWTKNSSGVIEQIWYSPMEVSCGNGELICSVQSSQSLISNQKHSWKVRARSILGLGPWSAREIYTINP